MGAFMNVVGVSVFVFAAVYALINRERAETNEEFFVRLTRQMSETLNVRSPGNLHGQVRVAIDVIKARIEDGADLSFQRALFIDALALNWPNVDRVKLNKLLGPARLRAARSVA